jgi:hypothetical protein
MVECLPSKHKSLNSNPSTKKKRLSQSMGAGKRERASEDSVQLPSGVNINPLTDMMGATSTLRPRVCPSTQVCSSPRIPLAG